jgi:hypothetical protein
MINIIILTVIAITIIYGEVKVKKAKANGAVTNYKRSRQPVKGHHQDSAALAAERLNSLY